MIVLLYWQPSHMPSSLSFVISFIALPSLSCFICITTFMFTQTQQNVELQGGLHFIWLHPSFFSMGLPHLGQGLVLVSIQFVFLEPDLFFKIHLATVSQSTRRWASYVQFQQKLYEQRQCTSSNLTAKLQPGAGHHFALLSSIYDLMRNFEYFFLPSSDANFSTMSLPTAAPQDGSVHLSIKQLGPSLMDVEI